MMNGPTLFVLMIVAAAHPENKVPFATFDSYLKCLGVVEVLKHGTMSMHPDLDVRCEQMGLPEAPPEDEEPKE